MEGNRKLSLIMEYQSSWKKVIQKTSAESLKQLAMVVQLFFKNYHDRVKKKEVSPLHIVIGQGEGCTVLEKDDLKLCKYILEKSNKTEILEIKTKAFISIDYSLSNKFFWFRNSYCQLSKRKPVSGSVIHMAAINGNLTICRLILDKVQ